MTLNSSQAFLGFPFIVLFLFQYYLYLWFLAQENLCYIELGCLRYQWGFIRDGLVMVFSCWLVSNSLWPHELQHTKLPCPSLTPRVCSNSCPLTQWCHPTISFSVAPFSSCPQSSPASGSFPVCQFFTSGGQNIGASAPVLPMNIQGWFLLGLTGLISLLFKGLSGVFSSTIVRRHQFFSTLPSLWSSAGIF